MKVLSRKDRIRFKFVDGLIRGYRNEPTKPGVPEMQYQGIGCVAQTITVGNVPKIYGIKEEEEK